MQKHSEMRPDYDRSKMQHKKGILRFEWGDYPAIGIDHFEQRRDERTKSDGTDIFEETKLSDEKVLLLCFKILEKEKYQEILDIIQRNKPKHTEFIAGFQTDEVAENGRDTLFVFVVFSISVKDTAMNGIKQGEDFLSCITIVKDTFKRRHLLPNDTEETTMCYYFDKEDYEYKWKTIIPRL